METPETSERAKPGTALSSAGAGGADGRNGAGRGRSSRGDWRLAAGVSLFSLLLAGGIWWRYARHEKQAVAPAVPAAEQRLLDAAAREPASTEARRELGLYYLQHRQPFEALWELEQTRERVPGEGSARVELATALGMAGFYDEAESELRQETPPSQEGVGNLAALLLATARPEAAIETLRRASYLQEWAGGQLLLARAHEALGQVPEARRAYERYHRHSPAPPDGEFRLGRFLVMQGQPGAARAILQPALRQEPGEARLLQLLAMTYSAAWGEREARDRQGELLTKAMQQSEAAAIPARLALGALYLRHGRFKEGGAQMEWVVEKADLSIAHQGLAIAHEGLGQKGEAAYYRGMAAVQEGHADVALREFQRLAALAPEDARAPQVISQTYAQMNDLDAALKAARSFYERGTRSPELYERLATLYLLTYNRRAARRLCEEWQRERPKSGRPPYYLGKIALADLQLAEAIRQYEAAVAREPRNGEHLLGLADALGHQPSAENSRRAVELLRQAVVVAPGDARPHYQLGVKQQQMGEWEAARRELLRSLDLDPTQATAANNLLQVATALRQPALAARFGKLMQGLQERKRVKDAAWKERWARPDDPRTSYALGRLLAREGSLASAEHQFQRAVVLRPGWAEARLLYDRVRRLLDGTDTDGRRLVRLHEGKLTAETQRSDVGKLTAETQRTQR